MPSRRVGQARPYTDPVDQDQAAGQGDHRVGRLLRAHNAPDLMYGAIVAGSVLAVSSSHADESAHVAAATALVTAIYWLAHVYVDAIGGGFRDQGNSMPRRIVLAMRESIELLVGAVPPVLVFLLAKLLGADVQTAALAALWFTVALLAVAGFGAAYLAGVRGWPLVVESLVAGSFGVLVILLKFLLH
jgi:hypothetical protein